MQKGAEIVTPHKAGFYETEISSRVNIRKKIYQVVNLKYFRDAVAHEKQVRDNHVNDRKISNSFLE